MGANPTISRLKLTGEKPKTKKYLDAHPETPSFTIPLAPILDEFRTNILQLHERFADRELGDTSYQKALNSLIKQTIDSIDTMLQTGQSLPYAQMLTEVLFNAASLVDGAARAAQHMQQTVASLDPEEGRVRFSHQIYLGLVRKIMLIQATRETAQIAGLPPVVVDRIMTNMADSFFGPRQAAVPRPQTVTVQQQQVPAPPQPVAPRGKVGGR